MDKRLQTLLREQGSFVTFLGPREPGAVPTVPPSMAETRVEMEKDPKGCIIECCGPWTGNKRRQFSGVTFDEAIDRAVDACKQVKPKLPEAPLDKKPKKGPAPAATNVRPDPRRFKRDE